MPPCGISPTLDALERMEIATFDQDGNQSSGMERGPEFRIIRNPFPGGEKSGVKLTLSPLPPTKKKEDALFPLRLSSANRVCPQHVLKRGKKA